MPYYIKKFRNYIKKNSTPYSTIMFDDFIGIFDRNYIDSLDDNDMVDTDKLLADIEWDILHKSSNCGVAKLNVYVPNQDLEMFLLFASSTFLIFQKFMQAQQAAAATFMYMASTR